MIPADHGSPRLFPSLRRLLDTGLAALHNRAELFVVEFREEKAQALQLLIWISAALFMAMMAVIVLTAAVVLAFPERLRITVLGAFCVLYLLGALGAVLGFRTRLKQQAPPFAETLNEVRKDRAWLHTD